MRRFELHRHIDPSGVSGTGVVFEGVEFSDGRVSLRWLTPHRSTVTYDSVDDMMAVHGHDGASTLVYHDNPDGSSASYDGCKADLHALVTEVRSTLDRVAFDDIPPSTSEDLAVLERFLDIHHPKAAP